MPDEIKIKEVSADELVKPMAEDMPIPTAPNPAGETDQFGFSNTPPGAETVKAPELPPLPPLQETPPQPKPEIPNPFKGVLDSLGREFDPTQHRLGEDGKPKFNKKGRFVFLKQGRPAGAAGTDEDGEDGALQVDPYEAAANMYFDLGCGAMNAATSSEDWKEDNADERKQMVAIIAAYLRAKQSVDLTPGQALAFGVTVYAIKRASRPKTKERLTLWFLKLKNIFTKK